MGYATYNFERIASAASDTDSKIELAARIGYAAKGLVYGTVGVLALMTAAGFASGKLTGTRGALEAFTSHSWGPFVLAMLVAGLTAFALWRAAQAFKDTEDKGNDFSGLMQRAGLLISGGIYGWLAFYALRLLTNGAGDGSSTQERAATVMAHDGGVLLVGAVGAGFVGVGLYQLYRAITARFKRNWKTAAMTEKEEMTATWVSRFGIGSRAISFLIIGGFLGYAAWNVQPEQARGLNGALQQLAQHTSGQWLVGLAGIGLLSYGIYCAVNALFRRIQPGDN